MTGPVRLSDPFIIETERARVMLTDFRDGDTALALSFGGGAISANLSAGQKLALAHALCESAKRQK